MPYKVASIDLTAVTDPNNPDVLVGNAGQEGKKIVEVIVLDMPVGQQFDLRLGRINDYFTVSKSFSMKPQADTEQSYGLYYRNLIPQAGVVVQIIIAYNDELQAVA